MPDPDPAPPHVHDLHGTGAGAPASEPTNPPKLAGAITDSGTYTPTRAMEDVMAERWRQIHTFNHTPEQDATRPVGALLPVMRRYSKGLTEHLQLNGSHTAMRSYAVKLAAATLAFIDRLDAEEN